MQQNPTNITEQVGARRRFLKQMLYGSAVLVGNSPVSAAVRHLDFSPHKAIALYHPQTGEEINVTYFESGQYISDSLDEINYLLRDYHAESVYPIDPQLIDQLYDLKQVLGIRQPIQVVSGYRSPHTNANLRHHSHRVAKHSLHMEGRAIDIRIEGISTGTLKKVALAMQRGGVGYYPRADFLHLDTGDIRNW